MTADAMCPATSFIGRADELRRLKDMFAAGARLVTVWGPAGIGKTRLALEHARSEPDHVVVDLTNARNADDVEAALASALGFLKSACDSIGDEIARRGKTLLVLDNFEQVSEHAPVTLDRWCNDAPNARFLVTSRHRLRLRAEQTLELGPLSLPCGIAGAPSEAQQLFVDRVRAHHPDFAATGVLAPRVADLVCKLEGIPLAIELAAARIDVLGVDGLLARIGSALEVLGETYANTDASKKTLRAALEWSWNLLDRDEQRTLAACSVFRGTFSLGGVEGVLGLRAPEAIQHVHRLRDRSLVRSISAQEVGGEPRFALFEAVRELASEKRNQLAADGESDLLAEGMLERRHAAHYADLARELVHAHEQTAELRHIEVADLERRNLTAALDWLLERSSDGPASHASMIALGLDLLFAARGPIDAHAHRLERVLREKRIEEVDPRVHARVLAAKGHADSLRGALGTAQRSFEAAIERARDAEDTRMERSVRVDLGVLFHQQRDFARATALYEQALSAAVAANDMREIARLRGNLGALYHDMHDLPHAREQYQQALDSFAQMDEPRLEGVCWTNLGIIEQEAGHLERALDAYECGLALLERSGNRRLVAITLGNIGAHHHERGALACAIATHEQALRHFESAGDIRSHALCLVRLAAALASNDQVAAAEARLRAAAGLARRVEDKHLREVVELHWAFVDLAVAGGLVRASKPQEASERRERARRRMATVHERTIAHGATLADVSDDVRTSLRILARMLDAPPHAVDIEDDGRDGSALVVGPDAAWYRTPARECQDLRRNQPMRRILLALVEQALTAPSQALTLEALQQAAWPGEHIQVEAGKNRVYVAIAQLRKRGLKEHLLRTEEGYRLAPTLRIRRSRTEWPDAPQSTFARGVA